MKQGKATVLYKEVISRRIECMTTTANPYSDAYSDGSRLSYDYKHKPLCAVLVCLQMSSMSDVYTCSSGCVSH